MSFDLSSQEYEYMQKVVFGNENKKGRGRPRQDDEAEITGTDIFVQQHQKPEEQGFMADFVDSVQMGAWQGGSDLARGLGVVFNSDWLNDTADWAARKAKEQENTMSTKMREALGQSAFEGWDSESGEGKGLLNAYWWAGTLGSFIGQNLDAALTLGIGKGVTSGVKIAGKGAVKYFSKEAAEKIGEATAKQATRFGIPEKYHKALGVTAVMSAMQAGSRANQVYNEVDAINDEDLAQIEGFKQDYWNLKESQEGQGLDDRALFDKAKERFKRRASSDAAIDPLAVATDLTTNFVSGLGGGLWGALNPAKTYGRSLVKGALIESSTEAMQSGAEQYAINDAAKTFYDPTRELSAGVKDNALEGAVVGGIMGGLLGPVDKFGHNSTLNKERKRVIDAIQTGDSHIDAQLQRYADNLNQWANDVDDLVVNIQRANAMNQRANAVAEQMRAQQEAQAQQQAETQNQTQTPYHQRNIEDVFAEFTHNGLDENDFNNFVESNLQQANDELNQLKANPFKMGADFQQGLAEKKAYQEKLADAQARFDYWTQAKQQHSQEYRDAMKAYRARGEELTNQGVGAFARLNDPTYRQLSENLDRLSVRGKELAELERDLQAQLPKKEAVTPVKEPLRISPYNGERIVYHGSRPDVIQTIGNEGIKFGVELNDDAYLGGGYGAKQNSHSASLEPNISKQFSDKNKAGIAKIQLADDANIVPVENEIYAEELEDYKDELKGVDAVYLKNTGEQELVILNKSKAKVLETREFAKSDNVPKFSLSENPNSDFAKAVDAVASGKTTQQQVIDVGTTPDVLKMLGLPDANVVISGAVLHKVMQDKHNVTAETLKQLPREINNPVAVMKSSTQPNGYVVLTELMERENGKDKPIIAALHLRQGDNGLELINIASVYGRSNAQIQRGLENDLLYWNKEKGAKFLDNLTLQLRSPLSENSSIASNIKTETDLGQFQSQNQANERVNFEQQKAALEQTHAQIKQIVGNKLAEHFEVVSREQMGIDDPTVEAGYDSKTGKIFIIDENIRGNSILSREERLKWVAWHELAHRGIQVKFAHQYRNLMTKIEQNTTIRELADAIQQQREETRDNRLLAVEEALAELNAAYTTGKMEELKSRYGIKVPPMREKQLKSWFEMTAQRIREFVARLFGKERAEQFSHDDLISLIKEVQGAMGGEINGQENGNFKHSFAGENAKTADHSLLQQAKSAVENGADPETVRQQTGWFKGVDGKWRFEIDDSQATFINLNRSSSFAHTYIRADKPLSQVFKHPYLFEAYPQLADIRTKIDIYPTEKNPGGVTKIDGNGKPYFIGVVSQNEKEAMSTLIHEVQHAIQEYENFAKGDDFFKIHRAILKERYNLEDGFKKVDYDRAVADELNSLKEQEKALWKAYRQAKRAGDTQQEIELEKAYDEVEQKISLIEKGSIYSDEAFQRYQRAAGETESRNVESRLTMDAGQRRNTSPFTTQDIPNNKQIIRFEHNGEAYSLNEDPNSSFAKAEITPERQAYTFSEAREQAKAFQGKEINNRQSNVKAVVSRNSLDKMLSAKAVSKSVSPEIHALAVANADKLYENALYGWSKPDRDNNTNIVAIHRMFAVLNSEEGKQLVKLTVKETAQVDRPNRLYTIEAVELNEKKPAAQWVGEILQQDNVEPRTIRSAGDIYNLAQSVEKSNLNGFKLSRSQSNVERLRKINKSTPLENMTDMAKAMASRPLSEWKSLMLEYGKRANTKIFDALAPIKYAEDKAGITDHSQSAYTAARLAAGSASISEASMLYGLPEYREGIIQRKQGTTEQDALFGILQSLGNDANDFLAWVAGNRADKLMQEGRENHLSQAEINELKALNKGKEAKFEQARQKLMAWNQSLLDLAESTGLINQEDRAKWEDKDFYIPFYRESEDGDAIAPYRNKGLSGQSSGIKRLKGSDKAINDLLENVITNATKLIDASVKNAAMTKAVTNLADTGVITLIENPTSFDWKKLGSNKHGADKDGGIAKVNIEGKEQLVRINDAMLFNAITSIDQQPLDYAFRKLFAGPKRVLTATVTSMPNFIVRNLLRDMAQAWVVDRNNGFKLGIDSIKGLKDAYKRTGSSIDLMFAGASFGAGYVNGGNPQEAAVHIRKHLRKKGKTAAEIDGFMDGVIFTKDKLSSVLDHYFHLNHSAENANRIAVYDRAIASGKSKAQAALESKDLMDFSMHGSAKALRILADMLPFFNARLQGMSQLGRAFKENPRALATRGAMIALASVALAAMNQGEDWYEEQGDDIKDNFWLANLGGQIIKIPKPFELGVVFGTVPERLYRTMSGADSTGRFKDRLLSAITNTLSLNPIPQAVKPIFEVYNNYDSFRGREIETLSDRRLMKEARYDDRTSLVSRGIAGLTSVFGLSPKQTDYLIHGYFGTLGMYVLGMSDLAIRQAGGYGELPAKNWQEYPVLDAVFGGDVAVPRKYTRYMNDYYNFLNQVSEISATAKSFDILPALKDGDSYSLPRFAWATLGGFLLLTSQ